MDWRGWILLVHLPNQQKTNQFHLIFNSTDTFESKVQEFKVFSNVQKMINSAGGCMQEPRRSKLDQLNSILESFWTELSDPRKTMVSVALGPMYARTFIARDFLTGMRGFGTTCCNFDQVSPGGNFSANCSLF